jgi:hypothetical protein
MPLITTPGSATADSYISATDAEAYHTDRGNTAWLDVGPDAQEAALRRATAWLDGRYRWVGTLASTAQALGWPRVGAWDAEGREVASNVVPLRIRQATAEAALYALTADLLAPQRGAAVKRRKVGPIETEYFGTGSTGRVTLPWVDALVAPLSLGPARGYGRGGMVLLERA